LAEATPDRQLPRGPAVRVLDLGVGASCIYPLLGTREYDWSFVGADIAPASLDWARRLVAADRIELRLQPDPRKLFATVTAPGETFAASLCNPPFYASAAEAAADTQRKLRNRAALQHTRNFGGQANGRDELAFVRRMIAESAQRPTLCRWFTTLVSQSSRLPELKTALTNARAAEVRIIPMQHGQKITRILARRF
jgi:23S rRNA (adenine1618-N6)-methyltransferase